MRQQWVALATLPVAVALVATVFFATREPSQGTSGGAHIQIAGQEIHVDLATSSAQRSLGLGGRPSLAPDQGMLFVFSHDGAYSFWMKDMRFSIDIIWIDADSHIVYVVPSASPASYPTVFTSPGPARYVLELAGGFVAEHQLRMGDSVTFTDPIPHSTE